MYRGTEEALGPFRRAVPVRGGRSAPQPRSSSPIAAIQLPATRTAMRVHGCRSATTRAETSAASTKIAPAMPTRPLASRPAAAIARAVEPAVHEPHGHRESRHDAAARAGGPPPPACPSARNESDVIPARQVRDAALVPGHAAGEPGDRQGEQRAPPGGRPVEAGQQRHRHHGEQVVEGHEQVRDAVVDRTETGGGPGARARSPGHSSERAPADSRRHPPPHASARQRKYTPARPTAAPAARSADAPPGASGGSARRRCRSRAAGRWR